MDETQKMNPNASPAPPPYAAQDPPAYPSVPAPYQGMPPPQQTSNQAAGHTAPPINYQYQAAPSGYAPVAPPPAFVRGTTVVVQNQFGVIPASCVCPNCHQNVVTRTEHEIGLFTWFLVGIIFICGGWIFCLCFLPFCIDSLKDVRHVCPNCNHGISYYKRM